MPLLHRPLVVAAALALGAFTVGCSHEHGPLADKPDTTSLGNAGRFSESMVSTSTGLVWRPANPAEVIPGTIQGDTSPLTTQARPMVTLLGTKESWIFGQSYTPETGWAMNTWTSGPNLPVEPWNMALESAVGEGGGEGHGSPKGHAPKL
jgi:hypothetical protein